MEWIPCKRANQIPGNTLLVLTAPLRDDTGRVWRTGSEFRGLCGGYDNPRGDEYAELTMLQTGRAVRVFRNDQKDKR